MERYDSYKDSGVEWIGEIPNDWTHTKMKYVGDFINGYPFKPTDWGDSGRLIIRIQNLTEGRGVENFFNGEIDPKYIIKEGDFLFSWSTTLGLFEWKREEGVLNQHIFKVELNDVLNRRFYFWVTQGVIKELSNESHGSTMTHLTKDVFGNIRLPLPPLSEQQQIVYFLDTKTSLIDSLIEKTQRKIELLKEKRTSLINEVVTKGLNPNVEMKDSGVEWIGKIPRGWEIKKLKHISDVRPSNVDKHIYEDEIQVHLCNYTDVYYNEVINSNTNLKKGSCNENEYEKFKLEKGDVIITKDSETPDDIGIPVYVEETLENVVCGYHLTMIKPISVIGKFIFRFIECDRTRRYFELNSNGVTRFGLGKSSIENLVLPIPSETEQQQIVEYLDEQTQLIDKTISIEEKRIELLKEYRQSLISEVVTGKRKVVE